MRPIIRRTRLAATAVALGLLLGACASEDSGDASGQATAAPETSAPAAGEASTPETSTPAADDTAASQETPAEETSAAEPDDGAAASADGSRLPSDPRAFNEQVSRAITGAGSATFRFEQAVGGGPSTEGTGSFRLGEDYASEFTATTAGSEGGRQQFSAIVLDGAMYLKMPKEDAPRGKPWLRISRGDRNPMARSLRPVLDQLEGAFDPEDQLGVLEGADAINRVGTETVDGTETTKYAAEVDLKKAAKLAEGVEAKRFKALSKAGIDTLDYTVWVDEAARPRRFRAEIPLPQGRIRTEGLYSAWGEAVDIAAPPAGEVATFDDLG